MANAPISREKVHSLAEACSDQGESFQPVATRLIKHQRRLSRFFEQNVAEMGPMASQVGLYMLSVSESRCLLIVHISGVHVKPICMTS